MLRREPPVHHPFHCWICAFCTGFNGEYGPLRVWYDYSRFTVGGAFSRPFSACFTPFWQETPLQGAVCRGSKGGI